jgi:nanoRNase/pAp phosphatase (c-di-AMP/oligoRNAs hydrolase)
MFSNGRDLEAEDDQPQGGGHDEAAGVEGGVGEVEGDALAEVLRDRVQRLYINYTQRGWVDGCGGGGERERE